MIDPDASSSPLLSVNSLTTVYPGVDAEVRAVDGVSFEIQAGERVAIVGKSGSGKSQTVLSILRLIQRPGRVVGGNVRWRGRNLFEFTEREMSRVRGGEIGLIFQDPMSSWNSVLTVAAILRKRFCFTKI